MIRKIAILVVLMVLVNPIKVFASSNDSYITWELDMSVVAHQMRNGQEHMTNLALMKANEKVAYCIEPGVVGGKDSWYSSSYDINDTSLRNIDTKKLSLIGYYGYGYGNHNTKEYYMATQELIWRLMGVEDVWWTDKKYNGNVINIESYKNEIMSLANNYEVAPSFNFKEKYIVGDEITLKDSNNVLEGYEVLSGDGVRINGNDIIIKVGEVTKFTLGRKRNGLKPIYYYKTGFQTIGTFEYSYDFEKEYNLNSEYAKIIVDKYDNDTKSKTPISKFATLKGASYAIYEKTGKFIKESKTDENGIIIFDGLKKGSYIIRETNPSKGYTKESYSFETYVASDRLEAICKRYEKIIKEDFIISKVYEYDNLLLPEQGTIFEIYDEEGILYSTHTTDKEGKIYLTLPYGEYTLRQLTTKDGYDKVQDVILQVKENKKVNEINLVNKKINEPKKDENNEEIKELPNTFKKLNYIPYIFIHLLIIKMLKNEKESN